jgi:hypothetical protein
VRSFTDEIVAFVAKLGAQFTAAKMANKAAVNAPKPLLGNVGTA